jgi:hypothetical protein
MSISFQKARGHTPKSLAEAQGKTEVAALLSTYESGLS